MTKPSEKLDEAVERLDLENYGIGVPFSLALLGIAVGIWGAKGMMQFDSLTQYGKFGIVVAGTFVTLCLVSAGYTYSQMETGWWVKKKEDAPEVDDG